MTNNYLKLQFYSLPQNQAFARDAVAAFCVQSNPSLSTLSDIKTAVSEAVTNCTVHAYGPDVGIITIECDICGDVLHISVTDAGRGIDDVERAVKPFYTTLPGDERSGMGFSFMEAFMDEVTVESEPQKGTRVLMEKRIGR